MTKVKKYFFFFSTIFLMLLMVIFYLLTQNWFYELFTEIDLVNKLLESIKSNLKWYRVAYIASFILLFFNLLLFFVFGFNQTSEKTKK